MPRLERLQLWLAWQLPRWLVSWAFIRVQANATSGPYSNVCPSDVPWDLALRRWDARLGGDPTSILRR